MFRFTIRDLLWLMVVASATASADEPRPTLKEILGQKPDEGRSSPSQAVHSHVSYHRGPQIGATRQVLIISWFTGDGRTVLRYKVGDDGSFENMRDVYNHAIQDWQQRTLTKGYLKYLVSLLSKLPESKAEPPIDRTVYVSFQSGNQWRSETYDAAALPDELEAVMKFLGERFETKDRQKKK